MPTFSMEKSRNPRYSGASGLLQEIILKTARTNRILTMFFIRPQDNSFLRQQADINFVISFCLNSIHQIIPMFILENEVLRVGLSSKGAELQNILNKVFGIEYLWNGNPAFWSKRSPVLFPIVGALKNNSYTYQGKSYQLPRHGFARDMEFEVDKQSQKEITLLLRSNTETKKNYPFDFEFRIRYLLQGDELSTEYMVTNTGSGILFFSVGGHPAFRLPLTADTQFSDYYLRFEETENLSRWPISKDGLIENQPIPVLEDTNRLKLQKSLFYQD